jgi:hypothetical protein
MAGREEWSLRRSSPPRPRKLARRRAKANRIRLIGLTAAFTSLRRRATHRARRLLLALSPILALAAIGLAAQDLGIRQYKPKSTLVVPAHPVPRARYPVIDVHSHHFDLSTERWATIVREMDALNLRLLVNLSGGTGDELKRKIAVVAGSPAPTRMVSSPTSTSMI